MPRHHFLAATLLFACAAGVAFAQASPSFTISATNTTMAASGAGIPFTLTAVNGYSGTVTIACKPPAVPADVYIPFCGGGTPAQTIDLKANATANSSFGLWPGAGPPLASHLNLRGPATDAGWTSAGALLLGFGFRRRQNRWLSILFLSIGTLVGVSGLTACGGGNKNNPNYLTPGAYTYTLNAIDTNNLTASTTAKVTVPPGIPR